MNKSKIKGSKWETQVAEELTKLVHNSEFRRVPGSGAMGTALGEPLLSGDISGKIKNFYKRFRGEAKAGYNHSTGKEVKQFTIKKEWLDKIQEEANNNYSIPFLACKFDNARVGVKHFIVLDINDFAELINKITSLQEMMEDERTI